MTVVVIPNTRLLKSIGVDLGQWIRVAGNERCVLSQNLFDI